MGYHADTCASIILLVSQKYTQSDNDLEDMETEVRKRSKSAMLSESFLTGHAFNCVYLPSFTQVLKAAKEVLLWCATPDGVFRAENKLPSDEFTFVINTYYQQQKHDNLLYYLDQKIKAEDSEGLYAQVVNIFKADI